MGGKEKCRQDGQQRGRGATIYKSYDTRVGTGCVKEKAQPPRGLEWRPVINARAIDKFALCEFNETGYKCTSSAERSCWRLPKGTPNPARRLISGIELRRRRLGEI